MYNTHSLKVWCVLVGTFSEYCTTSSNIASRTCLWVVTEIFVCRYRLDMINWSTRIRREDYAYFCRAAEEKYNAIKYVLCLL